MSLQDEINEMKRTIHTDGYPMSIGELASIYKEKELDIHPEFQRFYRWDEAQKSSLIESILLDIPIPPIFVSQNEKNMWDVVDGLQRLSTIFEFMGICYDKDNRLLPASILRKTKFLPSLEGKLWEKLDDEENSLSSEQRLLIKRAKLDIKIIKTSSTKEVKYDLFQRLNTGGTPLSPQEIRNCLLIMENKEFFDAIAAMNQLEEFRSCIPLSENSIEQQTDMEYVVRFIIARHCDLKKIVKGDNIQEYLNDQILDVAQSKEFSIDEETRVFTQTFRLLNSLLGEMVFKKYSKERNRFEGGVLISSYEAIVLGVSKNIESLEKCTSEHLVDIIKGIYERQEYISGTAHGVRPLDRFQRLSILSMELFSV